MALLYFLVVPGIVVRLDPLKNYRGWAKQTESLLNQHQVYFWGEIRSGAMIYSDRLLPVLTTKAQLAALGPADRLIVTNRRWRLGVQGLDQATLDQFRTIYRQPQGGDELQILAPLAASRSMAMAMASLPQQP